MTRRHMLSVTAAAAATPALAQDRPLVFAASSLKNVLDEVSAEVSPMRLSYGGSGALARQIVQGAPADVFLSANASWMESVEGAGKILNGTRRDLLGNRLVLVSHEDEAQPLLPDWQPDGRIAMGFVESVPAGQYGKAAFEEMGIWQDIQSYVVETENARAALALVSRRELPYAVVYATDAMSASGIRVLFRFSADLHPPIRYPIGLVAEAGRKAYDALIGSRAAAIFQRSGFEVL